MMKSSKKANYIVENLEKSLKIQNKLLQLLYLKLKCQKEEKIMKKNKKQKVSSSSTDKMFLEQPVEMTNPTESQKDMVKGQGKILAEKKRSATWY
jgi:hypothetical protein